MNIIHAVILGIVEGITEFLPVSSTAHLIIASYLLKIVQTDFTKSFEIIIQLGSIAAVVVLYWKKLIYNIDLIKKVIVAFIPTAILGLIFYKAVKALLGNNIVVVCSLVIGGIILIIFELWYMKKSSSLVQNREGSYPTDISKQITYKQAGLIGLFQSIAFIPGVSRSAATIVGGQLIGLSRKTIIEFSFLLAIPTMLAASALDVLHQAKNFNGSNILLLLVGFVVSFVVALFAIRTFLAYIQKHSFVIFGVYRIVIGLLFLWILLA